MVVGGHEWKNEITAFESIVGTRVLLYLSKI